MSLAAPSATKDAPSTKPLPSAAEIVAQAAAIAPALVDRQAETEDRSYYAEDVHAQFGAAGFYRMLVPRRYGGCEYDIETFARVIMEIARGCPSTAWQLCLATAHALQVGSFFEERAQDELFAAGDFLCASVAAPTGVAQRTAAGGWMLNGTHHYCSGAPYATHYMGQTFAPGADPEGPPGPPMLFVAPRSEWTMLDDWGGTLGLKGSGSHSIRFEDGRIPDHFAIQDTLLIDFNVIGGTAGSRLHGNAMYAGRALSFFAIEFAALTIGMVKGALDAYEHLLKTKTTARPPIVLRSNDPDYQRWYGTATSQVAAAEAALINLCQQFMAACELNVSGQAPFDAARDLRLNAIGRECVRLCWNALQEHVFRTAGSSAARNGERLERIWRDMSMAWGHLYNVLGDWAARNMAKDLLGEAQPTPAGGSPGLVK